MPTFTFTATATQTYHTNDAEGADTGKYYFVQGADADGSADNEKSLIMFDATTIRNTLQGYTVQSCTLDNLYVHDVEGNTAVFFLGSHNYTSLPNIINPSRLAADRVRYTFSQNKLDQQVNGINLGSTFGQEFKDGVSTGILIGPAAYNSADNGANFCPVVTGTYAFMAPKLTIVATSSNVAPNAPSINSPASPAVADISAQGVTFSWSHSDPNGDAQAAYRFRRNKGGGVYDYWNGTTFVSGETRMPTTTQSLTVPPGVWANNTSYAWSVRTEDPGGLVGPWSTERTLYASTTPTVSITAPTGNITVARPTLRWTFTDADGQPQYSWIAQVVSSDVYNAPGYSPDNYTSPAFSTSGTGTTSSLVSPVDLQNHKTYRAYVKVASSPVPATALQFSAWTSSTFLVLVPPYAPAIAYPQNGSNADLAAGFTLDWNNTFYGTSSQTAFTIRRITAGGSYQWWNGLNWSSTTEVWLSGTQSQYAFRPTEISNGITYTFSIAIRDDYSQTSPYSTGSTVTGSAQAQVTIISPQTVAITTRPLIQWSEYDPENDPQQTYQVRIISDTVYGGQGATWDPGAATAVWSTAEVVDTGGLTRNVVVATDLSNGSTYRAYVRVKTGGVYSGWAYSEFQVSLIGPAQPELTTVVDQDGGAVEITIQGRDSFFPTPVAGNFSGWEAENNCTVANQVFFASAHSSRISTMTATTTGTMSARTSSLYTAYPGQIYTAAATISMATGTPGGGRQSYVSLEFLDGAGATLTNVVGNVLVDDSAQRSIVTAAAPEDTVNARIHIQINEPVPTGGVHVWFDPVFRPGTGGEWSPGGLLGLTTFSVNDDTHNRQVRRAQGISVPTTNQVAVVRDEELYIGHEHTYSVISTTVYPGNVVLNSVPAQIGPVSWTSGWLWLSDPLRPGSAHAFGPQSLGDITRPVRQSKSRPLGRPDAVITTGARGLREGSFKIVTWTRSERDAFDELASYADVLMLRIPPDQGDERGDTLYIRLQGDAPESRALPSRTTHRTIEQAWVEQNRPLDFLEWSE